MKSLVIKFSIIASMLLAFVACSKDEDLKDTHVTAVKTLYEPTDGKSVVLQSSASMYFEWEPAKAEDGGMVLYEIAFDKEGGDFSAPIYKMASDNNGGHNYVTLSHKLLNKIALMAGMEAAETGKLIWTVFSSKGINEVKALESRTLEITCLTGFADVPTSVYITGEGSEGGADLSKASIMKPIDNKPGEFEIYTKLTAGKNYYFTDAKVGTPRRFYVDNKLLKEGTTAITPAKTGVYRIYLDFTAAAAVYTEVTDMQLFFCPTNSFLFSLPYVANGEWKASSQPISFKQEGWGRDERYKFKMTTVNAAGETVEEWWGTPNTDSRPNESSPASYYYLYPVNNSQWDGKFKFAGEMDLALADVSVLLQAENPYTHVVKKVGNQ